jgi:cyclohexanecarboxylate-CoA ligase
MSGVPVSDGDALGGDTLYASLVRACRSGLGDRRALAGPRDAVSWAEVTADELVATVDRVSAHLAALGVRAGEVLCLVLPNWTEAVIYTYAASRLGAAVCPVTTIYRRRELGFILERTGCRVVVVPSTYRGFDYAEMATGLAAELSSLAHVVVVGDTTARGVVPSRTLLETDAVPVEVHPSQVDDLAVLAFTSGTTGEPKGVMHTHASMHAMIDDLVGHVDLGHGLTSLVISPFGHLTGFLWGALMPLRGGGDVVMLQTWDAGEALDLVERYAVGIAMGATPFLRDLLDTADARGTGRLPDVYICGGAPIPPSLVERAVRTHDSRVVSVWGMSEYPVGTATSVTDDPDLASCSDGRPCGRAEVVVVDVEGAPVPIGGEGDLVIRGPGRFTGYYKRPDLDVEALTPNGFLRTGDRARLLDDRGHIRISGRSKDIIIRGGENIPVVEIENLLLTHPSIQEVAIVPLPHERLGETACACLVLRPGAVELSVADVGEFLAGHGVSKHFFPETVRTVGELPRTPSGKIQKFLVRAQALRAQGSVEPVG